VITVCPFELSADVSVPSNPLLTARAPIAERMTAFVLDFGLRGLHPLRQRLDQRPVRRHERVVLVDARDDMTAIGVDNWVHMH